MCDYNCKDCTLKSCEGIDVVMAEQALAEYETGKYSDIQEMLNDWGMIDGFQK